MHFRYLIAAIAVAFSFHSQPLTAAPHAHVVEVHPDHWKASWTLSGGIHARARCDFDVVIIQHESAPDWNYEVQLTLQRFDTRGLDASDRKAYRRCVGETCVIHVSPDGAYMDRTSDKGLWKALKSTELVEDLTKLVSFVFVLTGQDLDAHDCCVIGFSERRDERGWHYLYGPYSGADEEYHFIVWEKKRKTVKIKFFNDEDSHDDNYLIVDRQSGVVTDVHFSSDVPFFGWCVTAELHCE